MTIAFEDFKIPLEANVIDIGCGTGFLGAALAKKGYKNFDGIDASEKMVERAKELGIYQSLDVMYMGTGDMPEKF